MDTTQQIWPVEMDWPTFMRPYRIGPALFDGEGLRKAIMRILPAEPGTELPGGFRLCRGVYNVEAGLAETLETNRGPCYVITMSGVVIGGVDRYALWIEPPYRKNDLAVELYVIMFIALGPERWMHNKYTQRGSEQVYTAAGFESRRRSYIALVERGYIKASIGMPENAFEAHRITRRPSENP